MREYLYSEFKYKLCELTVDVCVRLEMSDREPNCSRGFEATEIEVKHGKEVLDIRNIKIADKYVWNILEEKALEQEGL